MNTTTAPTPAAESRTLGRYVDAANQKAARTGKPAASREAIALCLSLAYRPGTIEQKRINVLTALKGGVSRNHCSVLIDQLKGTYGGRRDARPGAELRSAAAAPVTQEAHTTPAAGEAGDLAAREGSVAVLEMPPELDPQPQNAGENPFELDDLDVPWL